MLANPSAKQSGTEPSKTRFISKKSHAEEVSTPSTRHRLSACGSAGEKELRPGLNPLGKGVGQIIEQVPHSLHPANGHMKCLEGSLSPSWKEEMIPAVGIKRELKVGYGMQGRYVCKAQSTNTC